MARPVRPQVGRLRRRGFGRNDFESYEDIDVDEASLGTRALGKGVVIDCRFLFKKSEWGTLTDNNVPGGIMYLDLDFSQPGEYCLKQATVTVTLNDDDKDLIRHFPHKRHERIQKTSLQISYFGPEQVSGVVKSAEKTRGTTIAPEVEVPNIVGLKFGEKRSEMSFEQDFKWVLEGQRRTGKGNGATYKQLVWTLTENYLEQQSTHTNIFHTAFAFQHSGRPLLLQVGISGKLKSLRRDLARKFSTSWDDSFATTLINFRNINRFQKVLDPIAKELPHTMRKANEPNDANKDTTSTYSTMPKDIPASNTQVVPNNSVGDSTAPRKENFAKVTNDFFYPDVTGDDRAESRENDRQQVKRSTEVDQAGLHTPHKKHVQSPSLDTTTELPRICQKPGAGQMILWHNEIWLTNIKVFAHGFLQIIGVLTVMIGIYYEFMRISR